MSEFDSAIPHFLSETCARNHGSCMPCLEYVMHVMNTWSVEQPWFPVGKSRKWNSPLLRITLNLYKTGNLFWKLAICKDGCQNQVPVSIKFNCSLWTMNQSEPFSPSSFNEWLDIATFSVQFAFYNKCLGTLKKGYAWTSLLGIKTWNLQRVKLLIARQG